MREADGLPPPRYTKKVGTPSLRSQNAGRVPAKNKELDSNLCAPPCRVVCRREAEFEQRCRVAYRHCLSSINALISADQRTSQALCACVCRCHGHIVSMYRCLMLSYTQEQRINAAQWRTTNTSATMIARTMRTIKSVCSIGSPIRCGRNQMGVWS